MVKTLRTFQATPVFNQDPDMIAKGKSDWKFVTIGWSTCRTYGQRYGMLHIWPQIKWYQSLQRPVSLITQGWTHKIRVHPAGEIWIRLTLKESSTFLALRHSYRLHDEDGAPVVVHVA